MFFASGEEKIAKKKKAAFRLQKSHKLFGNFKVVLKKTPYTAVKGSGESEARCEKAAPLSQSFLVKNEYARRTRYV